MRLLSFTLVAVVLCSSAAGHDYFARGSPRCNSAPVREPNCDAPPSSPEQPPRTPQQPPAMPVTAIPQGMFVQPPASGVVRGPVEQRGVEGVSITFPAHTLQLPSIRWPACFRTRTDARMELAPGLAPYVQNSLMSGAYAPMALTPAMTYAPPAAGPPASPEQPTPPSAPTEDYPPRAPDCEAPRAPSCDHASLDQRLRAVEAAERRLLAQLAEYERLVARQAGMAQREGIQGAVIHDVPPADRFNAAGQARPVPPPAGIGEGAGRQATPPPQYVAQPAAYVSEPPRLPVERHWIAEPRPEGRIIGLRPYAP